MSEKSWENSDTDPQSEKAKRYMFPGCALFFFFISEECQESLPLLQPLFDLSRVTFEELCHASLGIKVV